MMNRSDKGKPLISRLKHATEAMSLALACLAPWALGSVHAQAELGLELGIVLLVIAVGVRAAWGDWSPEWRRRLFCLPSLALAGLTVLALAQAMPLPKGVLSHLAPARRRCERGLSPRSRSA